MLFQTIQGDLGGIRPLLRALFITLCAIPGSAQSQSVDFVPLNGTATTIALHDLPRQSVPSDDYGAKTIFEGVWLRDVRARANVESGAKLRGPALSRFVVVVARDSYRVTFSLAELDQEFTNLQVLLADRLCGKPLSNEEGPLRIVVPKDRHGSRSARQAARIELHEPGNPR